MYCKYCGKALDENARFCSECGNSILEVQKEEVPKKEDSMAEDTPIVETESEVSIKAEPFFKLPRTYYCLNCGSKMERKECPNCHQKKNIRVNNYCQHCGSVVEEGKCVSSGISVKPTIIEKILRIISIALICFSFIGVIVHITSDRILPALLIFVVSAFLSIFIVPKKQIYKIKCFIKEKNIKQSWIIVVYILVILAVVLGIKIASLGNNNLSGDDLAAYELIVEASYDFKNPSSVRLVSGTVFYDEEAKEYCGWFALSATNGYGGRTVGYYFVGYLDGEIFALDLEEDGDSTSIRYAKTRDELDVDKINKSLEKKWKNAYND